MYQTNIWAVSKMENKITCFFPHPVFTHGGERISLSPKAVGKGEAISWQPQENLNLLAVVEMLQNK